MPRRWDLQAVGAVRRGARWVRGEDDAACGVRRAERPRWTGARPATGPALANYRDTEQKKKEKKQKRAGNEAKNHQV